MPNRLVSLFFVCAITAPILSIQALGQQSGAPSLPAPPMAAPYVPQAGTTAQILTTEPAVGQLPAGARVLIDDGTCPAGQLKQVTGSNDAAGQPRLRSCVPRP